MSARFTRYVHPHSHDPIHSHAVKPFTHNTSQTHGGRKDKGKEVQCSKHGEIYFETENCHSCGQELEKEAKAEARRQAEEEEERRVQAQREAEISQSAKDDPGKNPV